MTTALFLLRCKECGFTLDEIDLLSVGALFDVFTEKNNDSAEYKTLATQEDFNRF